MAQAARRVSKSSLDWAAFYQKVPAREREVYRALKNRSDYFVNKVHGNPESLGKIDFAQYRTALPGLKMVDVFEQGYSKVTVPYPVDKDNVRQTINEEEAKTLAESAKLVKELEHEKVLSTEYLAKLDTLPPWNEVTMEMLYDYFPWSNPKGENPQLFPFNKASQPENLALNESKGLNNLLKKIGLNIKV